MNKIFTKIKYVNEIIIKIKYVQKKILISES